MEVCRGVASSVVQRRKVAEGNAGGRLTFWAQKSGIFSLRIRNQTLHCSFQYISMDRPSNRIYPGGRLNATREIKLMTPHQKSQMEVLEGSIESTNALIANLEKTIIDSPSSNWGSPRGEGLHEIRKIGLEALENTAMDIPSCCGSPEREGLHGLREIKRTMQHLESQMDGPESQVDVLDSLESQTDGLKYENNAHISDQVTRQKALENKVQAFQNKMQALEKKVQALENKMQALENKVQKQGEQITNLENRVQKQVQQITKLISLSEMHFKTSLGLDPSQNAQSCKILSSML